MTLNHVITEWLKTKFNENITQNGFVYEIH